jgi:hypothetical protein
MDRNSLLIFLLLLSCIRSFAQSLELTTTQLLFNPSSSIQFDFQEGEGLDLSLINTNSRNSGLGPNTIKLGSITHRSYSHIFQIEGSDQDVSIINDGIVTRNNTGTADLLPIAFGSVCKSGSGENNTSILSNSTQNFSAADDGSGKITLTFPNQTTSRITLIVSPIGDCGGSIATQTIHSVSGSNTIDVTMYTPLGALATDMSFSFVAYQNPLISGNEEN